jgi:hypothetical protein
MRNFLGHHAVVDAAFPRDLVPRIVALEKKDFEEPPPGGGAPRRLGGEPDAVLSHGLDLATVLSPKGTGLVGR